MRGWGIDGTAVLSALLPEGCAPPRPDGNPTDAIRGTLALSADRWNAGDLDGFTADYVDDSTTSFTAGGGLQCGFEWIRANCSTPRFTPDAVRDSLHVTDGDARPPGPRLDPC